MENWYLSVSRTGTFAGGLRPHSRRLRPQILYRSVYTDRRTPSLSMGQAHIARFFRLLRFFRFFQFLLVFAVFFSVSFFLFVFFFCVYFFIVLFFCSKIIFENFQILKMF
jgi:hypothetical protein